MKCKTTTISTKTTSNPLNNCIYAVVTGTYVGEMLIYIEPRLEDYVFLSVPKNVNRYIPKDKFEFGMNHGIIELVEEAPQEVVDIAIKQFFYNEDPDNRR